MKRAQFTQMSIRPSLLIASLAISIPAVVMAFIAMPTRPNLSINEKDGVLNIEELMHRVLQLNQQKKHQEALDLLLAAIDKHKDDSLLRAMLTQTFDLFLEDEVRIGQEEIKVNKYKVGAYTRVAGALELMGDNFRAMEVLINGVSLNPNAAELWMKVGKLEHKGKRDLEALDVFKEVIRLEPSSSDAYNNAAFVLAQTNKCSEDDLKEAAVFAQKARNLDPNNPEYMDTLAEVHYLQGNQALALSLIKEALKIAPDREMFKSQLKRFSSRSGLKFE